MPWSHGTETGVRPVRGDATVTVVTLMDVLVDFARTGRLGPLHCGMPLAEAETDPAGAQPGHPPPPPGVLGLVGRLGGAGGCAGGTGQTWSGVTMEVTAFPIIEDRLVPL